MIKNTKFNKTMSTFSLTMTGVTTMVGSGWLLATQKISNVAGPAGLFAWVIGAIIVLIIALFCIEIGTTNPSAGGIGYYSSITHGRFSGFMTQWINWLSIMAVPPVEAQAIVQYLSATSASCHDWYNPLTHNLTNIGICYALGFMLFFMLVNYWGLKLFVRFNNIITVLKVLVPVLTIICLLYIGFHPSNFISSGFAPFGFSSIATAVISCGVVMSFNGFQSPLTFSEEIPNPKKQLPIAIISAILITFVLYFLLQLVFIGSVKPADIINGWQHVNLRSPYVDLLIVANLQIMAWVVMVSAAVAPASCGAGFIASSSRILFNMSKNGFLPESIGNLDANYHSPRLAMILNTLIGCIFLFLFRGWAQLVAVISILHVFSYISMPVVVIAYRKFAKNKDSSRVFRLPFARLLGFLITWLLSALLFYAGWPHIGKLLLLCIPGILLFSYYHYKNFRNESIITAFIKGSWLLTYLAVISLIGYLGNNLDISTTQKISQSMSMLCLGVLSFAYMWLGVSLSGKFKPSFENIGHVQNLDSLKNK